MVTNLTDSEAAVVEMMRNGGSVDVWFFDCQDEEAALSLIKPVTSLGNNYTFIETEDGGFYLAGHSLHTDSICVRAKLKKKIGDDRNEIQESGTRD